ncbi:hypothetical protein [Niveibacterium sp. SC-1]|uniref:hypothetical protein n=1 Tax=Niveibacterium sp. SC-1 TaxID=3135646 RepID=UPI00311EE95D
MPHPMCRLSVFGSALAAVVLCQSATAWAASRTPKGRVSIAQVVAWVDTAASDPAANDRLVSYVSGVVEGALAANAVLQRKGQAPLLCPPPQGQGRMDGAQIVAGMHTAQPDTKRWPDTEATPALLELLLRSYPCPAS